MSDVFKLLRGFETLDDYFNKEKVIEGLVELVLEGRFYEDEAFLELLNEFNRMGLIEKYQDLVVKARAYFQERFDYMERKPMLGYLEFFKQMGILFEDKEAALLMKEHVDKNFHAYELSELFQVFKLLSHNFYRGDFTSADSTFRLIEDAVKIRASEPA
jgi:hypothetical protein